MLSKWKSYVVFRLRLHEHFINELNCDASCVALHPFPIGWMKNCFTQQFSDKIWKSRSRWNDHSNIRTESLRFTQETFSKNRKGVVVRNRTSEFQTIWRTGLERVAIRKLLELARWAGQTHVFLLAKEDLLNSEIWLRQLISDADHAKNFLFPLIQFSLSRSWITQRWNLRS